MPRRAGQGGYRLAMLGLLGLSCVVGVDKRIQGSSAVYRSTVRANQSLAWEARDNYERELSMHASLSTTELAPKTID